MPEWDPNAVRKTLGLSAGGWDGAKRPKGLIHTTEGFTLLSAMGAYANGGYAPHITIGPHPDGGQRTQRWQHYPFSSRATTLADSSGGVRTNRLWVYQVEVVGTCDDRWKGGQYSWLHVDNWPGWYRDAVAELMADWEEWFGIPRKSTVTFRPYPSSYGTGASQRLGTAAFSEYTGWLGHQHAPENSHGDPGDLDIKDLFARMSGTTPVEEDMPTLHEIFNTDQIPNMSEPGGEVVGKLSLAKALSNMEATQDQEYRLIRKVVAQLGAINGTVAALSKALAEHGTQGQLDPDLLVAAVRLAAEEGANAALASGVVDVDVTVRDQTGDQTG